MENPLPGDPLNGFCDFDSNQTLTNLALRIFLPIIFLRLYGYMYYLKRDPVEFYGFGKLIEIIF